MSKHHSLIPDAVEVYFNSLDAQGRQRFLTRDLALLTKWYGGSFYSLRSRFKPVEGIELAASKQTEYAELAHLFYLIRGFGTIKAPSRLFRLTKLTKKVKRDQVLQWNDTSQPMTSWTDDAVSMFRFSPENSMNTTAVALEVDELFTKYILMDHFLMTEFLDYVKSRRIDWIKSTETITKHDAISLKPQITQIVKEITNQLREQREYILYLGRGESIQARVTGTMFTAA